MLCMQVSAWRFWSYTTTPQTTPTTWRLSSTQSSNHGPQSECTNVPASECPSAQRERISRTSLYIPRLWQLFGLWKTFEHPCHDAELCQASAMHSSCHYSVGASLPPCPVLGRKSPRAGPGRARTNARASNNNACLCCAGPHLSSWVSS